MNVSFNKESDVVGRLVITVNEADYADKVSTELKKIQKQANIPGFRKGAVPMPQIKRRYEKAVISDTLNKEVNDAMFDYLQKENIHVLGEPMPVKVQEITDDVKDYTFEFEVGLAPELNVVVDKSVELPYYKIEVSDKMVEDQNKAFNERFGAQVPGEEVDEKAVIKGSLQQLNADGTVNTNDGAIQVISAIVAPFTFKDKEEAAKFLGKKVNDKVVYNPYKSCEGNAVEMASLLNIDKAIAGDIKDDFEFAISEIIVVKPAEHNQDFYDQVAGRDKVHNEEEYTEFVKNLIASQLEGNSVQFFDATGEKYFYDKYQDMQLPDEVLKKWLVARNEELTAENIDEEYAKLLPSLKWQIIRDAIASKLDVKVDENDMLTYARLMTRNQFAQYGIYNADDHTIEEAAKRLLNSREYRSRIAETVSTQKLFNTIRNAVNTKVEEVSLDKFIELNNNFNKAEG
ncbi:MAG: trigger factor [Muribaculaceae bacterium]|nr:trigger factor [Muribaculaceae bacterium]